MTLDRLLALGFTPWAEVIRLYSAPFGDPLVFRVRGSTLAIGRAQARQLELREKNKREKSTTCLPL